MWFAVGCVLAVAAVGFVIASRRAHSSADSFIPALGFHALTGLYDSVVAVTCREALFKRELARLCDFPARAAALTARDPARPLRVLDVGCGSGTLLLAVAEATRAARREYAGPLALFGVDADPAMLANARRKLAGAGLTVATDPDTRALSGAATDLATARGAGVSLVTSFAQAMPLADGAFDTVVSSLFFHHLTSPLKLAVFRECHRVLAPGGQLRIADWGGASNAFNKALFAATIQLLDGFETTSDNVAGRLPELMTAAGFVDARETGRIQTVFGTLSYYSATKPLAGARAAHT